MVAPGATKTCPECGFGNRSAAHRCAQCGSHLYVPDDTAGPRISPSQPPYEEAFYLPSLPREPLEPPLPPEGPQSHTERLRAMADYFAQDPSAAAKLPPGTLTTQLLRAGAVTSAVAGIAGALLVWSAYGIERTASGASEPNTVALLIGAGILVQGIVWAVLLLAAAAAVDSLAALRKQTAPASWDYHLVISPPLANGTGAPLDPQVLWSPSFGEVEPTFWQAVQARTQQGWELVHTFPLNEQGSTRYLGALLRKQK